MITVTHGDISDALGLARKSGQAIRNRQVARDDMAFLAMMNDMQAREDRNYANEISAALQAGEQASRNAMAQQEIGLRNRALDQQQQQFQAQQTANQQKVATEQAQKQAMQSYVEGQNNPQALAYFNATGKLPETLVPQNPSAGRTPTIGDDPEIAALKAETQKLKGDLDAIRQEKSNVVRSTVDSDDPRIGQLTALETAAVTEYNQKYAALVKRMREFQSAKTTQEKAVAANTAAGSVADLKVNPQVVQQAVQAQQPVPESSGSVPVVNTLEEYAQLPSGTVYVDGQTGIRARKP